MRALGPLEAAVMERMWQVEGAVSVRSIHESLSLERAVAYTTVMTVMDNLFHKGVLDRARAGRAYVYTATRSREEHTAVLLGEVLADSADRPGALMHIVEQLDRSEVARLLELLDEQTVGQGDPAGETEES